MVDFGLRQITGANYQALHRRPTGSVVRVYGIPGERK